ncbi:CAP domain-containing protein [Spirosoma pollinicola]|uniref:CAP domain-containing protein n=1 Tax=Spirosoma pollinicola TaxID=2057025 RepID=A0A2K8Z7A9_9BACT|nr:CAP domain-containing protein [Spirosoma pollinicola]AUD05762.1 CAP domain-containing protein [Spirosoma pollinicola]
MNWWILFQMSQWLASVPGPPQDYMLSADAFFADARSQQLLILEKPDTLLLDVALFQATNEARRLAGLPSLRYDPALSQAAQRHAESMIQYNYTSHEDLYDLSEMTLLKRIQKQTNRFGRLAENVGQYQTIDTPEWFGVRFNAKTQRFEFLDIYNNQLYRPHTYASYARYAVGQLLNSARHRANLLNPLFTHVGCAVRLSSRPFRERRAPFGRLAQNFGAPSVANQASR